MLRINTHFVSSTSPMKTATMPAFPVDCIVLVLAAELSMTVCGNSVDALKVATL